MTKPNSKPEDAAGLEPGLLSVFQMILAVVGILQILGLVSFLFFGKPGDALTINARASTDVIVATAVAANCVGIAFLLAFLYSKQLMLRLKHWFLPVAIGLYTVGVIVERYVLLNFFANSEEWMQLASRGRPNFAAQDSVWGTLLSLLVVLVMIAWQYDIRRVIYYVVAIFLVEAPLLWFFYPSEIGRLNEPFIFIAIGRTVIFLAVGYIVTRMIGAQKQQRIELAMANDKLFEHAATLEQLTISRERNRMARELHDTLAHSLSAVSVQLEAVDSAFESSPADARRLLTKALAQTRSGLSETRRALQSLRASPLDDLGLKLAIQTLAETIARRGGMKLALNMEDVGDLPPVIEQDIYRIAQEAMNNVLKHATASHLEVSLLRPNGHLILTVKDNGTGFVAAHGAEALGHFGLQGMSERAELIGAKLTIDSDPGGGTTVQLKRQVESYAL